MFVKKISWILIFSAFVGLVACAQQQTPDEVEKSVYEEDIPPMSESLPANFAHFIDIPIPKGSMMDLYKTKLFGSDDYWIGWLYYSAPYNAGGMFDFFIEEMPKYGWKQLTVVRSKNNVMTYQRGKRIATIQLFPSSVNGTEVSFIVSPVGMEEKKF